jgi:hypothetical protein
MTSDFDPAKPAMDTPAGFFMRSHKSSIAEPPAVSGFLGACAENPHMSNQDGRPPKGRLRTPNVSTVISAAEKAGQRLISATIKPDGDIALTFAALSETPAMVMGDPA